MANRQRQQTNMKCFLPIILFLVGCGSKTLLDRDVDLADSKPLNLPTQKIDSVVVDILRKNHNLRQYTDPSCKPSDSGLIKVYELRDTATNSYVHIRFSVYQDLKASFNAFRTHIDTEACCVPEEDIVKLKNYENLIVFKNGASKVMLTDNTVITMYLGNNIDDNKQLNRLVDSYFTTGILKKLEIGNGGPAIWTIK